MIPPLQLELEQVAAREIARRRQGGLAVFWGIAAAAALALLALRFVLPTLWPALLLATAIGIGWLWLWRSHLRSRPDTREIARLVEKSHPELETALLAALDQEAEGNRFSYLQIRIINAALESARYWHDVAPAAEVRRRRRLKYGAAAVTAFAFLALLSFDVSQRVSAARVASMLDVQPGDAEIERGSPVTFTARFAKTLPAAAVLHMSDDAGRSHDLPLLRTLEDPVFTASLPAVGNDLRYRVEFGGGASREFRLKVYDPPRVEQVDAHLHFPAYTGQPDATMKDTRTIAAIEQTDLMLQVRTNTPMRAVELRSKDGKTTIPLQRNAANPALYTSTFKLEKSAEYEIALADEAGRPNARPERFDIKVHPNLPPVVKAKLPGKKDRATPLQELSIEAAVQDDFGLNAAGLVIKVAGGEPQQIAATKPAPGARSIALSHLVKLEDLGVKPNDLIIWNAWGEDIGPDGKPRRTNGDVHITPVRFFDETARQAESASGPSPGSGEGQELIKLQTDILNGTWAVRRDSQPADPPRNDVKTLHDSQSDALKLARDLEGHVSGPAIRQHVKDASKAMQSAADRLARGQAGDLPPAIDSEQDALSHLYHLLSDETIYTETKDSQSGSGESSPHEELELKKMQPRYEQETAAQDEQGRDVRETLNRLRDLAQRQRDLNEEMNRLQLAIRDAATEEQRAELQRELQRLRDQQQELLADADRARHAMDESKTSPQQPELEKARKAAEQAARKLDAKQLGDALAEGSRAQREFEEAHEAFRQASAGELSEQLRQLREKAHDLADRQQEIGGKLEKGEGSVEHRTLNEDPNSLAARTQQQAQDFEKFMDAVSNAARLAAEGEPLVSQRLDAATRDSHPERIQQALDAIRAQVARNDGTSALEAQKAAEQGLQALQQRIDEATSKILGSEAQSLKFAQAEIQQLRQELNAPTSPQPGDDSQARQGQQGQQGKGSETQPNSQSPNGTGEDPSGNTAQNSQPSPGNPRGGGRTGASNEGGDSQGSLFGNAPTLQAWTRRLQQLEAAVDIPSARDSLARAESGARDLRIDAKRHTRLPSQALVEEKVLQPLLEAEMRINRALSEMDHKNPLAPVEHDPVPEPYSEVVQRYYESLGQ